MDEEKTGSSEARPEWAGKSPGMDAGDPMSSADAPGGQPGGRGESSVSEGMEAAPDEPQQQGATPEATPAEPDPTGAEKEETRAATGPGEFSPADKRDLVKEMYRGAESSEPELPPLLLNRTEEVFVAWPDLRKRVADLLGLPRRIIVVAGELGTGRFTTAVWIGLMLRKPDLRPRIVALTDNLRSGAELLAWVRSIERQRDTVYVLQEPLGGEFAPASMPKEDTERVEKRLANLRSWLILTTKKAVVHDLAGQVELVHMSVFQVQELQEVLNRHVQVLSSAEPGWSLGEAQERLLAGVRTVISDGVVTTAPQVVRLLNQLPEFLKKGVPDEDGVLQEQLKSLAKGVASGVTQVWFARLTPNEQLLALIVEAFRGIRQSDVEHIYCEEAVKLSGEGTFLKDPRAFGFDDLYRRINVQTSAGIIPWRESPLLSRGKGRRRVQTSAEITSAKERKVIVHLLEFTHESYRREVLRQMKSWHHLLWGLVTSLQERLGTVYEPWQAPQRQALGEVIARLGIHRPDPLTEIMKKFAEDNSGIIASLPGYILRGVCLLDQPDYGFVCKVLSEWVEQPSYVWAAMAALWRVYAEVAEAARRRAGSDPLLEEVLTELRKCASAVAAWEKMNVIESEDDFLSYAIERMFEKFPEEIGALVCGWLDGGGQQVKAGRRAAGRLFRINVEIGSPAGEFLEAAADQPADPLAERRFRSLLKLVEPMLCLDRETVDEVLEVLLGWTSREVWQPLIAEALLKTCNRARDDERDRLRRLLASRWLRAHHAGARKIAQIVVRRARLLDGAPTDLPGAGAAALIVDASEAGREHETAARLTVELHEFLQPQVDLWVLELGNRSELCRPGSQLDVDTMVTRRPGVRVVMPWLEALEADDKARSQSGGLHFAFVIHWKDLVDLDDEQDFNAFPVVRVRVPRRHLEEGNTNLSDPFAVSSLPQLFAVAMQHLVQKFSQQENERRSGEMLRWADRELGVCLSHALSRRTAADWWELLRGLIRNAAGEECEDNWRSAAAALEVLTNRLDEAPALEKEPDPVRIALGLVQWMAADRLEETVRMLTAWMHLDLRDGRGNFAAAAATMLLRIHSTRMFGVRGAGAQPAPTAATFLPLLELGPALARREGALGILVFLIALRSWAGDRDWAGSLRHHAALRRMVDAAPEKLRQEISEWLKHLLSAPVEALGEKAVPESVSAMGLRLRFALASRAPVIALEEPVVVVAYHASSAEGARRRLPMLACRLHAMAEAQRKKRPEFPRFVFLQAGVREPVAVGGENVEAETFQTLTATAAVLAPTFEYFGAEARLIVLLADGPLTDADDWLEPAKGPLSVAAREGRLEFFWDNRHLPPPADLSPWTSLDCAESEDKALSIILERMRFHFPNSVL